MYAALVEDVRRVAGGLLDAGREVRGSTRDAGLMFAMTRRANLAHLERGGL